MTPDRVAELNTLLKMFDAGVVLEIVPTYEHDGVLVYVDGSFLHHEPDDDAIERYVRYVLKEINEINEQAA